MLLKAGFPLSGAVWGMRCNRFENSGFLLGKYFKERWTANGPEEGKSPRLSLKEPGACSETSVSKRIVINHRSKPTPGWNPDYSSLS